MKLIHYFALTTLLAALFFLTPGDVFGKNNKGDNKDNNNKGNNKVEQKYQNNDNNNNNKPHNYSYNGHYKNFDNNNHSNRYYYNGNYYNFHDYYHYYRTEKNEFTYEGSYERHGDIFIFSDRYGNEFDLYVKPVSQVSRRFRGYPMQPGDTYNIKINPTRMYPRSDELRVGINFSFGWGNLSLQDNSYFDMYTAPELVNINGRLYIR